jgi:hypothetical protein
MRGVGARGLGRVIPAIDKGNFEPGPQLVMQWMDGSSGMRLSTTKARFLISSGPELLTDPGH